MSPEMNDLSLERPDFLRTYLLGGLSDEEVDAVEHRMLADDAYFDLVEAMEGDLLTASARGELTPEQNDRVMRRLAASPSGQARLHISRGLIKIADTLPRPAAKLLPFSRPRRLAIQITAMAASLLAVAGGLWLSRQATVPGGAVVSRDARMTTGEAVRHLREATGEVPAPQAHPPLAPPAVSPAPQPRPSGLGEPDARAAQAAAPERHPALPPAVFSLALSVVRSGNTERPTFTVPSGTGRLEIQLPLEGESFPAYRATVLDAATDETVWQGDLKPRTADQGALVVVALPAAKLPRGTYRMELRGVPADGEPELVGNRLFDVRTQ